MWYAAWAVILCKYGYSNQAYFGVIRTIPRNKKQRQVGLFIKAFPLMLNINKNTSSTELLMAVKQAVTQMRHYDENTVNNSIAPEVPFESIFDYKNETLFDLLSGRFAGIIKNASFKGAVEFPLSIEIWRSKNDFYGRINFDPEQFEKTCITKLAQHLSEIIVYMHDRPQTPVGEVQLLGKKNKLEPLKQAKTISALEQVSLFHAFNHAADKFPNKIAVVSQGSTISYQALRLRSLQLAQL